MNVNESSRGTVRTIHLDDEEIAELLDEMDTAATVASAERNAQCHKYRMKALVVHMQQPGSSITVSYLVPTRHISDGALAFLHGGFVHPGTCCLAQLITTYGTWNDASGQVASCRYVNANVHEVILNFDRPVDPSVYCASAVHTRVLLAEDDPGTARLARFHLEQLNADVEHVGNGRDVVDKAMENVYDLILLDMDLPEMDGFEAARELRKRGYSGTIIAITGLTQPDDRKRCLEAGCDKYVPKPYQRKDLDDLLNSLREEPLISSLYDDPTMADVINEYVQELPKKVRAIEENLAQANLETLQTLVRTMKSEGSSYGFDIITETAARIETALINDSTLDDLRADLKALAKLCMQARGSAKPSTAS